MTCPACLAERPRKRRAKAREPRVAVSAQAAMTAALASHEAAVLMRAATAMGGASDGQVRKLLDTPCHLAAACGVANEQERSAAARLGVHY